MFTKKISDYSIYKYIDGNTKKLDSLNKIFNFYIVTLIVNFIALIVLTTLMV